MHASSPPLLLAPAERSAGVPPPFRLAPGPRRATALLIGIVLAVLLFQAVSGGVGISGASSPAKASAAVSTTNIAGAGSGSRAVAPAPLNGFSGPTLSGEVPANPSVVHARILANNSQQVFPVNPGAVPTARPVSSMAGHSGSLARTSGSSPALNVTTGYITGTVVDSRGPHNPLSGVQVTANPLAGFCPVSGCVPVETDAQGQFSVLAATGENVVLFEDAFYMTNRTWTYVNLDGLSNVGTIQLVHDAFVTGVVRGDDPAHEPVDGIQVTAQTRDGTFQAVPPGHTDPLGAFSIPVPPVSSYVQFSPIFAYSNYETNTTFVNVSAGQTLNLGTIFLEKTTEISIEIVDSTTGQPIGGPASIQVTSEVNNYAPAQGSIQGGPIIVAQAPVGPDSMTVYAAGYLVDQTTLGVVPATRPGTGPIEMRTVDMVPLGVIEMNLGIQGGAAVNAAIWPLGEATISACSLDSVDTAALTPSNNFSATSCTGGCDPFIGQYVVFSGLPLRNYITVAPDTGGACGFGVPTWPIPGDLPAFSNYAWANVTPNAVVNIGHVDLLPGTYVQGEVFPAHLTGWDVLVCSTDEPALCGPASYSDQAYLGDFDNQVPLGCPLPGSPSAPYTFCAATPPGPDIVRVLAGNASQNYTWIYNPPYDYSNQPLPLSTASATGVQSINLTLGWVTGRVLQARSLTPVAGLPSIQVCPAGLAPGAVICGSGAANTSGFFNASAPIGWDKVTVSVTNYLANSTWVYVSPKARTGTILLTPYGFVNGQVVDASGNGILEAVVQLCAVRSPTACSPVGADGGQTSTDGFYFGATPAGALPVGAYEISASAPGYQTDWTWVNISTPGENFTAPTIVLQQLPPPGGAPAAVASGSRAGVAPIAPYGSWVSGRVVDATNGIGLFDAGLSAVPVLGGAPIVVGTVRGTGGEFNDSLPVGAYHLSVTLQGYYPTSLAFNVTGNASTAYIGLISLIPYPRVSGQLVIDPWRHSVSGLFGMGPGGASVAVCTQLGAVCGAGITVDTSGYFNVSAPAGIYDELFAKGVGTGPGMFTGGFVANSTYLNVTNGTQPVGPPLVLGLSIFGTVIGTMVANGTQGRLPVWFESITASSNVPYDSTEAEVVNASGAYALFLPPSQVLNMTAGGIGAWVPQGKSFSVDGNFTLAQPDILTFGNLTNLDAYAHGPSISLVHFGWIDARVVSASTHAPVPYATLSASEPGTLWGLSTSWNSLGQANAAGFVNMTAPPSMPATARISVNITASDFAFQLANVTVNTSRTSYLNGSGPHSLSSYRLEPWGWIDGSVFDASSGAPISGAVPVAKDPNGTSGVTSTVTNGAGYFSIDAPPSSADHLAITAPGYLSNSSFQNVGFGKTVTVPPVHLVGMGIVSGVVRAFPSGREVAAASITICPLAQPACTNGASSNASGVFTLIAKPGADVVTVSAPGYVTNSQNFITVYSDTWVWMGPVTIYEYATVEGVALGIPGGAPLARANASLCAIPLSGVGVGPCFATVATGTDGSFRVQAPAGNYILDLNATFYNDSFLSVALTPGELLPVGTLLLQEYGTATGSIRGADTLLPIPGARATACQRWGAGNCEPTAFAGADGRFLFSGPPGPYTVQANAPGYQAGFTGTVLVSGGTVRLTNFSLVPIGPGSMYPISGVVYAGGQPLPGAVVVATGGFSATTNSSGGFAFEVPWGTYTFSAHFANYLPQARSMSVTGPVSGLRFDLTLATYTVHGVVQDGLTGAGISGVHFLTSRGTDVGGVSGASGAFSFQLPNGTQSLDAVPVSSSQVYASASFTVAVAGAALVHNLTLYPLGETVQGLVVNSLTGNPIAGVAISVTGTTAAGVTWSTTAVSGPDGRFVVTVYPGSYTVDAIGKGYHAVHVTLQVVYSSSSPMLPLSLALAPMSSAPASSGASGSGMLWIIAGIGGAVAVGVVLVVASRMGAARPPPGGSRSSKPKSG